MIRRSLSGLVFFVLLLSFPLADIRAQESITFEKLAELLDPYFAPELVGDVKAALPGSPFDVWGFDVGDYSGDGFHYLIVSIRLRSDKKNDMKVYYFVDIEGMLQVVRQENAKFFELPIEVGVTISNGNAYLVFKREEYSWEIFGRRYRDGVVMLVDRYTTNRNVALTHEQYRNYQTLESYDRYLRVRDDAEVFRADFLTVPSYRRGRHISAGYAQTISASTSNFVLNGAYYWQGEKDLRINARSAWDAQFLYYNIIVDDDEIVPISSSEDSVGDHIEIWLDMYGYGDRLTTGARKQDFRLTSDTNIYGLTIALGDLADKEPGIEISTTNLFDEGQTRATSKVRAVAARLDSGWSLKVRIPFSLFGYESAPIDEERLLEIGSSVVVHDIDNQWRPEEETTMTTSHNFDRTKPATFGSIVLVPPTMHYGESENIFLEQVKERLQEIGY